MMGLVSGLGAATADAIYGLVAGFGLSIVSNLLVQGQSWLSLIGGTYLCYLGIKTIIANPKGRSIDTSTRGLVNAYGQMVRLDRKYTCYRIYPTHQWHEGEVIREDYWYVFPSNLPRMRYSLTLGVVDEAQRRTVRFRTDKEGVLDRNGFVILLEI